MSEVNGELVSKRAESVKKRSIYLYYTFLFVIMAAIVFLPFIRLGKSLVHAKDGLYQHYNAFVYLGTYIRSIVRNLIATHKLVIPMWEFGIGYGADVITTLSYYVIGDPLALVSIITPVKYADIMYSFLIIVRLYLAGTAFCIYARKMGRDDFSVMCAGLGYAFCGFALYAAIRHPFFATPMICLPLMLTGIEKILRQERSILFVFMVFVSCISNYYFFYQIALVAVLYVLTRCTAMYKKGDRIRPLVVICMKYAGLAMIGVAMAAVVFLPSAMAFLSSSRLNPGYRYDILYPAKYYKALAGAYISNRTPGSWTYVGVTPAFVLSLGALYIKKGGEKWLKWIVMLMSLFLVLPFFGHLFNGLGYVCNRWSFAYAFFLAYAFACMLPQMILADKREKQLLGTMTALYSALCIGFRESRTEAVFMNCVVLWMSLFIVFNSRVIKWRLRVRLGKFADLAVRCLVTGIIMLGIWGNSYYAYADEGDWDAVSAHDIDGCYADIAEITGLTSELTGVDDSFYRLDIHEGDFRDGGSTGGRNALISDHQSTTSMYWSVLSPYLISYLTGNSAYGGANYEYRNLQSRALLLPFASAKYYVHEGDGEFEEIADVPYGYQYLGKKESVKGNLYTVYRSELALPMGYTYDGYITASEYEAMSVEERQQAMLYGVVLDDSVCGETELEHSVPQYRQENLGYSLTGDDGIEIAGKKIIVKRKNAEITLQFRCPSARELYVKLKLSGFTPEKPSEFITEEEWNGYSRWRKENIRIGELSWEEPDRSWLEANCGARSSGLQCFPEYGHVYDGRTDYLFNLGYSEEIRDTVTISFSEPGIYSYDGIDVIAQPVDMLEECITLLKEDTLERIEIADNRISGVITADHTELLCLSVPYSSGWSIFIDGKQTELLQSNVMYMGAVITEGTHSVELRYETPYLREGLVITIIGFVSFAALALFERNGGRFCRTTERTDY